MNSDRWGTSLFATALIIFAPSLMMPPFRSEARVEGPPAHAVVAGAVGRAHEQRQVGHVAVRNRIDHLCAVLDDAALPIGSEGRRPARTCRSCRRRRTRP